MFNLPFVRTAGFSIQKLMKEFLCILGTAHMQRILGKCSPDKTFYEWQYSRSLCSVIKSQLDSLGIPTMIDFMGKNVPANAYLSQKDLQLIELSDRVALVNAYANLYGKSNVIFVAVHVNASGMGDKWKELRGWCCHTTKGQTKSDQLSELFYKEAERSFPKGTTFYKDTSDGDADLESDLYVLRKTACPAVLTENFFMDNMEDLDYLQSNEGYTTIAKVHAIAIYEYFKQLKAERV